MVKSNSNPSLLKTIVCPRDMLRLKAMLPEKRYKKCSEGEKLPSVNASRNDNQKVQLKNPLAENKNYVNIAPQLKNANNGRPASKQVPQRPGSPSSNYDLPVHERLNRRPDSGKEAAAKREIDAIIAKARCRPGSPNRPNSPNYQNRDI